MVDFYFASEVVNGDGDTSGGCVVKKIYCLFGINNFVLVPLKIYLCTGSCHLDMPTLVTMVPITCYLAKNSSMT